MNAKRGFTPLESPAIHSGVDSKNSVVSRNETANLLSQRDKFERGLKPRSNFLTEFTLIEIMIVVAIVTVLITVAVPNFIRSRVVANEVAVLANIRAINNACQSYHINNAVYPNSLSDLSNANPPYIDTALGSGSKQGYNFNYTLVSPDHFTLNINPSLSGLLAGRYFYLDESGIVRVNSTGAAGPNDEIVK